MKRLLCIVLLICLLIPLSSCSKGSYEDGFRDGYDAGFRAALEASQQTAVAPAEPEAVAEPSAPDLPIVAEPKNGHIFEETTFSAVAPFTVETTGTGGYFVVLDPLEFESSGSDFDNTRAELMAKYSKIAFYVTAGSSAEILVPLGKYEMYYATGETWYGEEHLFGPDTVYNKCDGTFLFTDEGDYYSGWTVTLEQVINGNLDTSIIDADDFPQLIAGD